jgi:hypothetical protein
MKKLLLVRSHKHFQTLLISIFAFGSFLGVFGTYNAYANIFGDCVPWCDGDEGQVGEALQKLITRIEEGGEPLRAEVDQLLGEVGIGQLQQQIAAALSIDLAPVKDVIHQVVEVMLVRVRGARNLFAELYKLYVNSIPYSTEDRAERRIHPDLIANYQMYYTVPLANIAIRRRLDGQKNALTDCDTIY